MKISHQVLVLSMFFLFPSFTFAQVNLADSSRLKDSRYLEDQIKNITDEDLFSSLNLGSFDLSHVRTAAEKKDFRRAYEAWASYWGAKEQPKYVTQNYHLLMDTDLLKTYEEMRAYARANPAEKDLILARAEKIMQHEIRTWGDVIVNFGPVVDFNKEIGKSGKYGFHYWVWSRPLNTANVLTGEQKYLAKFDELFNRWYEQRNHISRSIPELDVVYYELGLGIRNRLFIEYYLLPEGGRTWTTHERMLKTILGAARWLYELERWEGYRPGNWQIVGSYMLGQIAMVFPEFKESSAWLELGLQRLQEHLDQDFFEDGGHSERAPRNYTLLTYLSYRNLYYLLKAYKVREDLENRIRESIGRTVDWWLAMLAPTGEVPAINDSHRGLFPVGILEDGAEFYYKPEVHGVLKNPFTVDREGAPSLPSFTSRHMPASGFTVMRSDWTRHALYMNINYGKFSGFHTHNDLLDFEVYAFGKALAVDAGIGLTYDDPLYVPWYQSSKAHNMVVVNDQNIERKDITGDNVVWSSTNGLDYFAGEHRGYVALGVYHRRHITFVKSKYWVVLDQLKCEKDGNTLSWYFHSPTHLIPLGMGFRSSSSPGILVMPARPGFNARVGKGYAASTRDLTPGKTEEIDWIAFEQTTTPNVTKEFPILLYPFRSETPMLEFSGISTEHYVLKAQDFTDHLYFPNRSDGVGTGPYDDGEVSTDAAFLLLHQESGQPLGFSLVDGTYFSYKGIEVWRSRQRSSIDGSAKG
ncbi:MAG: alginate lyase family protein [Bacteroidota bacterium]